MSVLLVGGDKLGNITDNLTKHGFSNIEHVTGRKKSDKKLIVSAKTDLILVLVDYVGHQLLEVVKQESKRKNIKVAFSKRSWTHMEKAIQDYKKELVKN